MVREVIINGDPVSDAANLHAALDALEGGERRYRLSRSDAAMARRGDGGERIQPVVCTRERPPHAALIHALPGHRKAVGFISAGVPARVDPEALYRGIAAASENAVERLVRAVLDDQSIRRQGAHEMVELRLDRGKIGKDVGVIELQVVQYRGARRIVQELGALVEVGGVVLVGLDHEESTFTLTLSRRGRGTLDSFPLAADLRGCRNAKACRHAEIVGNPANQESGREPGIL